MASRHLRTETVPDNVTIAITTLTTPENYTHNSCLDDKYLKHIPCAGVPCTNVGTANHTHASFANHIHTICGTGAHTHVGVTNFQICGVSRAQSSCSCDPARGRFTHTHNETLNSVTPVLSRTSNGVHTHNAQTHDPNFRTYRFVKKNTGVSLRKKQVPIDAALLWVTALADIPNCFTLDTAGFARLTKATLNACTAPGSNAGRGTHTHDNQGHTHTVCIASHNNHTVAALAAGPNVPSRAGVTCNSPFAGNHTHSFSAPTIGSSSDSNASNNDGHTHDAATLIPSSIEVGYIKRNSLGLRRSGIPNKAVALWNDALACIPTDFNETDGSCSSPDFRDRYPLQIPCGSTAPGSITGSNSHTHTCDSHTHTVPQLTHTHTVTGNTNLGGISGGLSCGFGSDLGFCPHRHAFITSAIGGPTVTLSSSGAHTHGSLAKEPVAKEIAFIQRL